MSSSPEAATALPRTLWKLQIPLVITHAADATLGPYVCAVPRFSYLAQLLPRLRAYYGPGVECAAFHHEEVALRSLAVGLLADLYRPPLPWRITVGAGDEGHVGDTFLNGAKEADFVRRGNAKLIMGMSMEDTTALWSAVRDNDYAAFARVNAQLLNAPAPLKHVPIRIYIPSSPPPAHGAAAAVGAEPAAFKVMQTLVPPRTSNRQVQTLGMALRSNLPTLFPSSRDPVLANVVLHGAVVPFAAPLEELMRDAAYPDGWLSMVVVLL